MGRPCDRHDILGQRQSAMDRYGYSIFCDDIRNELGG
jgi:hypothetical protein